MNGESKETAGQSSKFQATLFIRPPLRCNNGCRFVLEVRKEDGTEYPLETLYHIVCGIMSFIRQNGRPEVDFFKNQDYTELRAILGAEMKRLKRAGKGSHKRQVEPLTPEEELLWDKAF